MTCNEQYYADVALCDQTFLAAYAACNGDPECQLSAIQKHRACQDAAYLKWVTCIGATGSSPSSSQCGCGEGGGNESGGGD